MSVSGLFFINREDFNMLCRTKIEICNLKRLISNQFLVNDFVNGHFSKIQIKKSMAYL
jgi:hypothetical protein